MRLDKIVTYLDTYLDLAGFDDTSLNGLQVENSGNVERVGLAVDASLEAFRRARRARMDLLIVHHGLFWGQATPLRGAFYRRIRTLMDADMALYAAHLPLDAHPEVGNNACIARRIGLVDVKPCGLYRGREIGMSGRLPEPTPVEGAMEAVGEGLGLEGQVWAFGPKKVRTVAVVSGSASEPAFIEALSDMGIDLYVTGETNHTAFHFAREHRINVFYGGHYATERFGIEALGRHMRSKFDLPVRFIDVPTGL